MAQLSADPSGNLLLDLLRASIKKELKADLMKIAEERCDAAADAAIAGLAVHIVRVFNERHGGDLYNVMVERIRPKEGT